MTKITVNSPDEPRPRARSSSATHRSVQKSSTLSRKYVRRPSPVHKTVSRPISARTVKPVAATKTVKTAKATKVTKTTSPAKNPVAHTTYTNASPAAKAKAEKDRAVKSALRSVATMEEREEPVQKVIPKKKHGRRILLALACSAATVTALVAFVRINMPDISVKVAAMQSGIEASYPTYVPRDYQLAGVVSEQENKITMRFENPSTSGSFTLSEERSTWDSTALLNNYVKSEYSPNFVTLREQGITIYIDSYKATWVNGGLLYSIVADSKPLSKEQIRNLVISL